MGGSNSLRCIVDTNVPIVASGGSDAGLDCVIACARKIREIERSGHVVIDDGWRILREYQRHLSDGGQPSVGSAFLKWVLTNRSNVHRCSQVQITPLDGDEDDFEEFPEALRQVGFDRSDRKFVAVAVADARSATILQGFDSRWWGWREALSSENISVEFLCESEIAAKHAERSRKG